MNVRLTKHALKRIEERGLGKPCEIQREVRKRLPGVLKNGVKIKGKLSVKIHVGGGVYAICVPELNGWAIVTVISYKQQ